MKYVFLLFLASFNLCAQNMDTKIIAHRGAWKEYNLPQNSITSLNKAIELKCFGTEFDVHLTKDNVVVVNHDHDFYGLDIETSNYNELLTKEHPNGEKIPTLAEYFSVGLNQKATKLILEIKTSAIDGTNRTKKLIDVILKELPQPAIPDNVEFILFDFDSAVYLKQQVPHFSVHYLNGDKSAEDIQAVNLNGIDYYFKLFLNNPDLLKEFQQKHLKTNSWTVNDLNIAKQFDAAKIDYITTDYPELFLQNGL